MIKVLAVDDEPLALKQMESYISKVPYLELVGACLNALEARSLLEEKVVDAMFLDINMPDLSGLEFVRSLDNPPLVVFTTAYSEYAIEGFKVEAVDYLLKPFGFGDFLAASERLKSRLELMHDKAPAVFGAVPEEDSFFFRTDYKTVRVKLLSVDENGRISLSIKKALPPEPKPASRYSAAPAAPKAPMTPQEAFEDKLKSFMADSNSRMSDLKHQNDRRSGSRRPRQK